ncbi:MAG: hypothetical protein ACR2OH_00865, partial [Microthrixaceae bacterium]
MSVTGQPRTLVDRHEAAIDPERRVRLGAHYTPADLATRLVRLGFTALGHVPRRVVDPSCGAGSILLAVADELLAAGVPVGEVPGRLVGFDLDPQAIEAAHRAIAVWRSAHDHYGGAGGPATL